MKFQQLPKDYNIQVSRIKTRRKILYKSEHYECDPRCINGVCKTGDCYCDFPYEGLDCSKSINIINKTNYLELIQTEARISITTFILLIFLAIILGINNFYWN